MSKTIFLLFFFQLIALFAQAQEILPADHKRVKKGQLSYDHTYYTMRDGFNIPSLRIPEKEIYAVKSPATAFLIRAQNLLEDAKIIYEKQGEIRFLDDIRHNIAQVKALDWYWECKTLELEYNFYLEYETQRYQREVVMVEKAAEERKKREQKRIDSLNQVFATENQRADSLERIRLAYLASRKDSIIRADRYAGYHFVNTKSLDLRAAPSSDAPLIVCLRACTYVQKLTQPDANGYVFVEVSDYKGYVLNGMLVDNLNKIGVSGADVKFAKENYFVSIYVPVGSTYDPMRQTGEVPKAISPEEYRNNPNALTDLVAKLERENKLVKERKNNNPIFAMNDNPTPEKQEPKNVAVVPEPNPVPINSETKTTKKEKDSPLIVITEADKKAEKEKKKNQSTGRRKQCTVLLPDGTQCPNVTTSNACRCYLHDN